MKLSGYFKKIQSNKLSDAQKNALYERILQKTQMQQPTFNRKRFYAKVVGYMFFLGILGFSIYLPYIAQQGNSGINVLSVHADYIAQVVTTQGEYYIESEGKRIEGNNISDGDHIVLAKDSSLVVHVGDHVEGKITGPATFVVHRKDAGYTITLEKGDYIELSTIGDQSKAPEVAVVSVNHKFTARTQAGKNFHFILTEKDQKPLVVNQSADEITVTNDSETATKKPTVLAQNKSVEVSDTIILAKTDSNPHAVGEMIAEKTNLPETKVNTDYNNGFFRNMLLAQSDTAGDAKTMSANTMTPSAAMMATTNTQEHMQATIDPVDMKSLRSSLIPQFVRVDVKYLTYYYLNGQQKEYQASYDNFSKRIHDLYTALHIDIPTNKELNTQIGSYELDRLTNLTIYLRDNLPMRLPANHVNTIQTMITFLQKLESKKFGEFKDQGLKLEEMFEKIQ